MSKKILLISSNSSSRGGGERYLVYLTQALNELSCDVHVLLSSVTYMDNWAVELTSIGATVHRQNLLGLRSRPLRILQTITDKKQHCKVAQICRDISPDGILVNQQYDEDGLDYLTGALMADVAPVCGVMHMPMTASKDSRPLGRLRGRLLQYWYSKHPYHLILVSRGCKEEFLNYYDVDLPISVVHHGCHFTSALKPPLRSQHVREPSHPTIGYIGQLVGQKNLNLLIESWLWMYKRGIESNLLLVGDGPERSSIQQMLETNAPSDRWKITGWQTNPEYYFGLIDIFAMTSHFEGLPLALIEAAGRKIPAVVTNFNGAVDVAERAKWVRVVENSDPDNFGKALIDALQHFQLLKHHAETEVEIFQDYFSFRRMGLDLINILGIC